jgi:UDP-N-acetylglucosamine--dolichyl-phosphate N-acetylglucosaminephosphotransferase
MTFILIPLIIPKLKARGIIGKDLNKPGSPEVAEMGGIAVVIGFFAGVSAVIALDGIENINLLNVSLSAIMGAALVGMMDDIFDMNQRFKAFLPFVLALPFGSMVLPVIAIPHVIDLDFGPFMIIAAAFAVTCAANAANMLEGFNGLGTGLGIIMALTLVILSLVHNRLDGIYLLIPLLGALVGFLWFNKFPAVIFPGDTMMLFMGATLAAAGMLSSLHVQTVFIFMPMIVEFFLKLRGRFTGENYSTTTSNGYLEYHGRIESLTHIFMRTNKLTEKQLVYRIWAVEFVVCAIVLAVDIQL